MADELLTVAEVASRLKMNEQTIRHWIDAGKLPARRVRILQSDFDAVVDSGSTPTIADGKDDRARLAVAAKAVKVAASSEADEALIEALAELSEAAWR